MSERFKEILKNSKRLKEILRDSKRFVRDSDRFWEVQINSKKFSKSAAK